MAKSNGRALALYGADYDPIAVNRLANAIQTLNDTSQRQRALRSVQGDDRRSLNDECGYPDDLEIEDYWQLYERSPIGRRVVQVLPRETWLVSPKVVDGDGRTKTPFVLAFAELGRQLRGEASWHEDEEAHPLWNTLRRADELCGIGRFGVIYIGLDDARDRESLLKPVEGFVEKNSEPGDIGEVSEDVGTYNLVTNADKGQKRKVTHLRAFSEDSVQITQWETNITSPRFGKPVRYSIFLGGRRQGRGEPSGSIECHWTRVVHNLSDDVVDSEVFSQSRLHTTFNRVSDVEKIQGADGETYFRNCVLKLFFETHPQLGGDVEVDKEAFRDDVEAMMNGLQQWMLTTGMSAKSIPPALADPTAHIKTKVDEICLVLGIPVPVFLGYEIGEQASTENRKKWNDRLRGRARDHVNPNLICPLIDRLIQVGALPAPAESYRIEWPDRESMGEKEAADIALIWTQVITTYVEHSGKSLMDPMDFVLIICRGLKLTEKQTTEMLSHTEEWLAADAPEDEEDVKVGEPQAGAAPEGFSEGASEMPGQVDGNPVEGSEDGVPAQSQGEN